MNLKIFRKKSDDSNIIELTSLIDVVFLLLIFFMVSTTFSKQETSINVKLPQSSIKDTVETREIIVTVTRNKDIYINSQKIPFNRFRPALQEALTLARKANVIIRGDKDIDYGFVVRIMTLAKQSGARVLDIATELEK